LRIFKKVVTIQISGSYINCRSHLVSLCPSYSYYSLQEIKNYEIGVVPNGIRFIPDFIKISPAVLKLEPEHDQPCVYFVHIMQRTRKTQFSLSIRIVISSSDSNYVLWWTTRKSGLHFGKGHRFLSSLPCRDRFWGPASLLSNRYRCLFPWGYNSQGVKLITYPHLVPRLRTHGVIPPLPIRLHGVVVKGYI
jgi:hypothetical protein